MQLLCSFALLLALPLIAETRVFEIFLKDHLFTPSTLYVPADEKVKLVVHNQDPTPEEFESFSLNREKVILGQGKGVVFIGPLQPGEHVFIGEYNPDTARGTIVVLPKAQWLQQHSGQSKDPGSFSLSLVGPYQAAKPGEVPDAD